MSKCVKWKELNNGNDLKANCGEYTDAVVSRNKDGSWFWKVWDVRIEVPMMGSEPTKKLACNEVLISANEIIKHFGEQEKTFHKYNYLSK